MPRTRFDKYAQPDVDLLKAFILERMNAPAKKITLEALADMTGMKSDNIRKLLGKNTGDWKAEQRKTICKALGLNELRISATAYYYENVPKIFEGRTV